MEVRFLRAARSRLLEIWDYTEQQWGESQADKYVSGLVASIHQVSDSCHLWHPVMDEMLDGVHFIRYKRHFVFFRLLGGRTIGVISILHESMDIPMRLREDTLRSDTSGDEWD